MDSQHYERYWGVFCLAARPILGNARQRLQLPGLEITAIEETSADDEKALGFAVKDLEGGGVLYVDIWLLDGEDRGFGLDDAGLPKVSVSLSIVDQDGVQRFIHSANNYGSFVGVSGSLELLERVNGYFDSSTIVEMVRSVATSCFKDAATDIAQVRMATSIQSSPVPGF